MSIDNIGKLTPLDESLNHQIADTFATVVESDYGWTEKIWAALCRKDGSLTISFGLGKYHNRNVMDGFGGVSRGSEQWTVRASRELAHDLQTPSVGPVRYEVIEPLKKVRFALDKNDTQPIAYDIVFEGELSPFFEKRNRLRIGNRIGQDVVRYQQQGKLSGWIEIDGQRIDINEDEWFGARDHSWGMRGHGVGTHPSDLQSNARVTKNVQLLWSPSLLTRPDGSKYQWMHFLYNNDNWTYFSAHINEQGANSGEVKQEEVPAMVPDIRFDTKTRQFLGGSYTYVRSNGERRKVEVTPLGNSGFYLRTGNYGGWNGVRHGSWQGELHVDGEYIPDIIQELPRIGQLRDVPIMVRDGDAVGYGIQESIYQGVFPELDLTEESSFPSDI
ncbi:MAG: hypothetical protein AB7E60_08140 [Sphingobium sp.]